jgi:hypothetical protein
MTPPVYTMHCVKDRWFLMAPAEHDFRGRTYERMEMRVLGMDHTTIADDLSVAKATKTVANAPPTKSPSSARSTTSGLR